MPVKEKKTLIETFRPLTFRPMLVVLVLMSLVLAACTSEDSSVTSDSQTETTAAGGNTTAATDADVTTTSASSGEDSATSIVAAIGGEPSSLDSLKVSDGLRDSFSYSVLEGLLGRSDTGDLEPLLAENWEPDDDGWTFTLRSGITFHDGSDLSAEDVVASYNRMLEQDSELLGQFVTEGTVIEAVDDLTVRITGEGGFDPTIPTRATAVQVVPSELAEDPGRMTTEMIGTGPYRLVEWNRGQNISLIRNEQYWGAQPEIDDVTIQFFEEDAVRLASIQAGEAQLATSMPADLAVLAPQVVSAPISEVLLVRLNTAKPPFDDVRVRQAANMAIDRQALTDELYGGFASPAQGQVVGQYVFGAQPDLEDYPYDPDAARALLEEAGAVGAQITFSASTGRWVSDRQVAEAIAGMLNEVGFEVSTRFPEFGVWVAEDIFPAGEDDQIPPEASSYNTSSELFDSSQTVGTILSCEGPQSTYCNSELDELATQALQTVDEAEREELYHQIWEMQYEDAAVMAVADVHALWFLAEDVVWQPPVDGFIRFQDISYGP